MEKIILNWMSILIVAIVSFGFTSCGDDENENNPQKPNEEEVDPGQTEDFEAMFPYRIKFQTYTVTTPGTLPDMISASEKGKITALKIKGSINGSDLRFIREMAGTDMYGDEVDDAALNYLDLSEARIVEGGNAYVKDDDGYDYETKNDILGDRTFSDCVILTAVVLPKGLKSIGEWSFSGCYNLKSIYIGSSVKNIGENAFETCNKLESVYITDLAAWCQINFGRFVRSYHLFLNGKEIKVLEIPNSVTTIGDYAFCGCEGLKSVNIPSSVTSIGEYAFWGCDGLTSVTIPNSVTSIGNYAFCYSGLTNVTLGNSVKNIGEGVFRNCNDLKSFVVEKNNTVYDSRENSNAIIETATNTLLYGCQNTTIPNSVTNIGSYAFYYCEELTSVTIPNSVTRIGEFAFCCSGLTNVVLGNSVKSIEQSAFQACKITSITIPYSVTSIGYNAFAVCKKLKDVIVHWQTPIDNISYSAFYETPKENLHIPAGTLSAYKNGGYGWTGFKNYIEDADNYPIE